MIKTKTASTNLDIYFLDIILEIYNNNDWFSCDDSNKFEIIDKKCI